MANNQNKEEIIKELKTLKGELKTIRSDIRNIVAAMDYMVGGQIQTKLDEIISRLPETPSSSIC